MEFENVIQSVTNSTIYDSFVKAKQVIDTHDCISVSISGGGQTVTSFQTLLRKSENRAKKFTMFGLTLDLNIRQRRIT